MATQLLIDADFVLYRDCSAVERVATFRDEAGNHLDFLNCPREEAEGLFMRSVEGYMTRLHADEAVLVFSGHTNFRKDVWPLYKANRAATRKPISYWAIVDKLKGSSEYRTVLEDGLEGDDYIGILATRPSPIRRVIVSEDKDMMTLPNVEIWRQGKIVETTDESAERFWFYQTLMGDSTDGYKGCPGVGPVAAEAILNKTGDVWENILDAYRSGCTKKPKALEDAQIETPEDLALLNARLARILRHTDWDGTTRRPILWSPPE